MEPLQTPDRAGAFLRFVADHADNPMTTTWGDYRSFDVYALAALAVGDDEVFAKPHLSALLVLYQRRTMRAP